MKRQLNNTDPIPMHVIEYTVDTGKETGDFRLITSSMDPMSAPTEQLAEAYTQRWEIVSYFYELKTHHRSTVLVLRSKSPTGAARNLRLPLRALRPALPDRRSHPRLGRSRRVELLHANPPDTAVFSGRPPGVSP